MSLSVATAIIAPVALLIFGAKNAGTSEVCPFGLCESATDYPEETVQKLLTPKLTKFFGNVFKPADEGYDPSGTRHGGGDAAQICKTKTRVVAPKMYLPQHRFIVNTPKFEQKFVYSYCSVPGEACFDDNILRNFTFKTFCMQLYSKVSVVTLAENSSLLESAEIPIPSACACSVKYD